MDGLPIILSLGSAGLVLTLAYAAEQTKALRPLVYAVMAMVDLLVLFMGSAYAVVLLSGQIESGTISGLDIGNVQRAIAPLSPAILAIATGQLLLLYPPFRRPVARVIPIDPDRLVHVVALHYAGLLVIFGLALAAIMPEAARSEEALRELETEMRSGGLALLWYQCIGFVIMAFLGAGLFIRRDWRQTLERLGLTAPVDVRWVVGIPVLGLASGWVVDTLTARALGPAGLADVERITDALFGPLIEMGLAGGISVALSAAIGEELVFRGAAQPRLGLTLTAVLFMLVHMQYTLSPALVQIFVMGLLLGVARMRSGTWTTMLAHALYDGVVFGIALMGHSASP